MQILIDTEKSNKQVLKAFLAELEQQQKRGKIVLKTIETDETEKELKSEIKTKELKPNNKTK
jgi:hypothetical protein